MSILNQVNHSSNPTGLRMVVYGQEKMGKTTFGCSAPKPLLIPLETGYGGVKVDKTPMLTSYRQVEELINEIGMASSQGNFPYQSIVFDSGTALERLIHEHTLSCDRGRKPDTTMESTMGGFGKGYTFANSVFDSFLNLCDQLAIQFNINIIITCHAFAARVIDPTVGEFDTWELQLHSPKNQKTYGKREAITQWADIIGFIHEPFVTSKEENGVTTGLSLGQGRVMGVNRTPNYVSGNRFGLKNVVTLPEENSWNALAKAIKDSKNIDYFNNDI